MTVLRASTDRRYTAEEFEQFSHEDDHCELIDGELREMPRPGGMHGNLTSTIAVYTGFFVMEHDLGICFVEIGFIIARNPDTVLSPDWSFVAKDRLTPPVPFGFIEIAPDIVLETRSPGDTAREVAEKIERWLEAGVKIAWELNPLLRELTVHRRGEPPRVLGPEEELSGEEALPGFRLPLRRLFPPLS